MRLQDEMLRTNEQLTHNANYPRLRQLKKRLETVEQERKALKEKLETKVAETDYESLKAEVKKSDLLLCI
ncbi:hypothetical protein AAVH_41229 [Aphelenchoides avenae]|nr:hypothetical protein AAVH_41229 [Aphelenchus avenae]